MPSNNHNKPPVGKFGIFIAVVAALIFFFIVIPVSCAVLSVTAPALNDKVNKIREDAHKRTEESRQRRAAEGAEP